jgi:hypothetical protein
MDIVLPAIRYRGALWVAVLVFAVLALVACGNRATRSGLIYRVNPPGASLQYLALAEDGAARAQLRLENFSTVPTLFGRVDLMLFVDGRPAGRIDIDAAVELPPLKGDAIDVTVSMPRDTALALRRANREIRYRLEGVLFTTAPRSRTPIEFDSRLTPVPGRHGEFR